MKAALNGALNCSILDGWWDECYDGENGWAIESAEDDPDLDRRDLREATSLFSILEQQVTPAFYDRDLDGVARRWVDLVRHAWASLGPRVTAARMVRDYTTQLYEPAAATVCSLSADGAAGAVELAAWRRRVVDAWPGVKVTSVDVDVSDAPAGTARPVTVGVELGGLDPNDVRVEVVHGPLGHDGEFHADLVDSELRSVDASTFDGEIVIGLPGAYGVTARVIPVHASLASPFDLGLAAWA